MNTDMCERLKEARKKAGLSQTEVGKLMGGMVSTTISGWESGRREFGLDTYIRLCEMYRINPGITLNEVYGYDHDYAPDPERATYEKQILTACRELNLDGLDKILEQINLLDMSGIYKNDFKAGKVQEVT